MMVMIIAGLIFASVTIIKFKDIAYGLVIVWAYTGILIKHLSTTGFDGYYNSVVITVIISLLILAGFTMYAGFKRKKA